MARRNKYATGTTVSVTKTLDQIKDEVNRMGGSDFAHGVAEMGGVRIVRVEFILPPDIRVRFVTRFSGDEAAEERRVWRVKHQLIKAKRLAIEDGDVTAADEFMAHRVLPDGRTFSEAQAGELPSDSLMALVEGRRS